MSSVARIDRIPNRGLTLVAPVQAQPEDPSPFISILVIAAVAVTGAVTFVGTIAACLVLRNTDLSQLAQVHMARAGNGTHANQAEQSGFSAWLAGLLGSTAGQDPVQVAQDLQGRRVLTAHAPVDPLG